MCSENVKKEGMAFITVLQGHLLCTTQKAFFQHSARTSKDGPFFQDTTGITLKTMGVVHKPESPLNSAAFTMKRLAL